MRLCRLLVLSLLIAAGPARAQFGFPPVNPTQFQVAGVLQTPTARVNFSTGLSGSLSGGTLTITNSGVFSGVTADSPLTGAGTAGSHLTFSTQTANTVFAGPSSAGPSVPTFRALAAADLPATTATTSTVGPAVFAFGDSVCGGNTSTEFLDPWWALSSSATTDVRIVVPAPVTVAKLYAFSFTAYGGAGNGVIYTVMKNGVATTITCTQAIGATSCNDTTHSATFVAGDTISLQKKGQTSISSGAQRCSASVQATTN